MTFNPADYEAVERKASIMSRAELEKYYVKVEDKKHSSSLGKVAAFLGILLMIGFVTAIGFSFGIDSERHHISDKIEEISEDICSYVGPGYESDELFRSYSVYTNSYSVYTNKIVCTNKNSGNYAPNEVKYFFSP